jgi:hypothetical protein
MIQKDHSRFKIFFGHMWRKLLHLSQQSELPPGHETLKSFTTHVAYGMNPDERSDDSWKLGQNKVNSQT